MSNIKTAEETYTKVTGCVINHKDVKAAMIEFAKLHVHAALKAASTNIEYINIGDERFTKLSSILNAYPLENIK